jgi:D-sedoheptulose 7-phosphate isomerase
MGGEIRVGKSVDFVEEYLRTSTDVLRRISTHETAALIELLAAARAARRRLFVCGNGGSAATASHFAAGLGKEGSSNGSGRFRVAALTDNIPWMTSLANDLDYGSVFVEQLINHAEAGDLLIAFSGSGNSTNVLRAVEWANDQGLVTVGITSRADSSLGRAARHLLCVDSDHIGHVEEAHFLVQHLITYYFRDAPG